MFKRVSLFLVYALLLAALPLYSAPFRFGLQGKSEVAQDDAQKSVEAGQESTTPEQDATRKSAAAAFQEAFNGAITAAIDCTGATIACAYSPTGVVLPSTTISMDSVSGLPQRIAFFLADPSDFIAAIESVTARDGNLLTSIKNIVTKVAEDPFLTASYINMKRKDYRPMDYIISGSMIFIYPQEMTAKDLVGGIMEMKPGLEPVVALIDLRFLGNKLDHPVSVAGVISIRINQEHNIEIQPIGDFMMDGKPSPFEVLTIGTKEF